MAEQRKYVIAAAEPEERRRQVENIFADIAKKTIVRRRRPRVPALTREQIEVILDGDRR